MYTSNRVLVVKDAVLVASPMEEKRRQRMRRSVKKGVRLRMFEECFTLRHEETKGGVVVVVVVVIVSHSRWSSSSSSSSSSSYGYASESFGYTRNRIENRIRRRDASTLPAAGRPRPRLRSVVVVVVVVRDVETPLTPRTNTSPGVLRDFTRLLQRKLVFPNAQYETLKTLFNFRVSIGFKKEGGKQMVEKVKREQHFERLQNATPKTSITCFLISFLSFLSHFYHFYTPLKTTQPLRTTKTTTTTTTGIGKAPTGFPLSLA